MTSKRNVKCRSKDTVYPHPYLTNVHADNPSEQADIVYVKF